MFKFFAFLSLLIPLCAVTPVFGAQEIEVVIKGTLDTSDETCGAPGLHTITNVRGATGGEKCRTQKTQVDVKSDGTFEAMFRCEAGAEYIAFDMHGLAKASSANLATLKAKSCKNAKVEALLDGGVGGTFRVGTISFEKEEQTSTKAKTKTITIKGRLDTSDDICGYSATNNTRNVKIDGSSCGRKGDMNVKWTVLRANPDFEVQFDCPEDVNNLSIVIEGKASPSNQNNLTYDCRPVGKSFDITKNKNHKISEPIKFEAKRKSNTSATTGGGTAKQVTVTGTVMCDYGEGSGLEPCLGVSVQEYKGNNPTSNGVDVGLDGEFSLSVNSGSKIRLGYTGFKERFYEVGTQDRDFGTITMEVNSEVLGEVTKTECSMGGAKEKGIKARDINHNCAPSACYEPRWKLKGSGKNAKCEKQECKFENGTGEWVENGDAWDCKLKECKNGYQKENSADGSGEYCREMLKKCTDDQAKKHPNATKTGIKKGTETCVAQECKCGFELKEDECVAWAENKECTADTKPRLPDDAASAKMVCDNDKAVCKIDKCVSEDYELKDNKCESKNKQPCTPGDKNATAGEYKNRGGKLVCVITACKKNYSVDKDNNKCVAGMVLSEDDQKARVAELEGNAKKMKEKEQSMENKLLGAAGMGMTGMGLMQSMSAGAEQKADEAAELDMVAYLATMHCNYAPGKNVKGGEKEVELPGANSLLPLYTEYVALANDLKARKEALGMRPGIESEAILDGATSGLYDDVELGKTSGAYTSLARALSDPNGEDAKKWAAQKEETAKDKKTGTTLAAVGAIGSAVANIAINKNAPKEGSEEIESKYDKKRVSADALEKGDKDGVDGSNDVNKGMLGDGEKECNPACNADTQNCVDGVCVEKVKTCTGDQELVGGECKPKCGADETRDDSGECFKKIAEKK